MFGSLCCSRCSQIRNERSSKLKSIEKGCKITFETRAPTNLDNTIKEGTSFMIYSRFLREYEATERIMIARREDRSANNPVKPTRPGHFLALSTTTPVSFSKDSVN